jgi:hypothetical protein
MDITVAMTWVSNRYAFGNNGPNRPVNQAGGEGFLLAGSTDLPSKVISRDAAGRIDFLLIFHRKGQKIDISLAVGGNRGHQDHRIAVLNHNGPGCLLGDFSRLDAKGFAPHIRLECILHYMSFS